MPRRPVLDTLCAAFFLAISGFFVWGFFIEMMATQCTPGSTLPCSIGDMERRTLDAPFLGGMAVLFFGLAMRLIWGMRHGE